MLSVCLAAVVFSVYRSSLGFQFILDDHRFTADPRIQNPGHIGDYFTNFVWAQFTGASPSFYRPMFLLWLRVNFLLSGSSPWGWHFLSFAKHLLVASLLGLLVWRFLRDPLASLLAVSLFALHPAHTESVSWVTVPDPLMTCGVLVALLCYFKYVEMRLNAVPVQTKKSKRHPPRSSTQPSPFWLLASVAAYFAALLTKETAIVFPAMVFALAMRVASFADAVNGHAANQSRRARLRLAVAHATPFLVVTAIYLLLRWNALQGRLGAVTQHLPWTTVVLSWPAIFWFYCRAMLWPIRSYSFADPILVDSVSVRGFLFPLLSTVLALGSLTLVLYWLRRKGSARIEPENVAKIDFSLLAGLLLLILPLTPALNLNALNPGDFLHGRYTYLPLAGLMLLAATAWHLAGKAKAVLLVIAVPLTALFGVGTFRQENQWKDDSTVFTIAHQLAPHNAPVARDLADTHVREALLLQEQGRCSEAIPVFREVAQDDPQDWYAYAGLGYCLAQMNDLVRAEDSLHHAVEISHDPNITEQWQELRAHMGLPVSSGSN